MGPFATLRGPLERIPSERALREGSLREAPCWIQQVSQQHREPVATEPVATEPVRTWSAATASTAKPPIFTTPICYRGHRLLLLCYMRSLLRLKQHDPDILGFVGYSRSQSPASLSPPSQSPRSP